MKATSTIVQQKWDPPLVSKVNSRFHSRRKNLPLHPVFSNLVEKKRVNHEFSRNSKLSRDTIFFIRISKVEFLC